MIILFIKTFSHLFSFVLVKFREFSLPPPDADDFGLGAEGHVDDGLVLAVVQPALVLTSSSCLVLDLEDESVLADVEDVDGLGIAGGRAGDVEGLDLSVVGWHGLEVDVVGCHHVKVVQKHVKLFAPGDASKWHQIWSPTKFPFLSYFLSKLSTASNYIVEHSPLENF